MADERESIDVDSLAWGSAAKDVLRKVYGNLDKTPSVMAMKIELANVMADFALKTINRDMMLTATTQIRKDYEVK